MKNTINVGIIGCGKHALRTHAQYVHESEENMNIMTAVHLTEYDSFEYNT